jgi:Methyltransferase domain
MRNPNRAKYSQIFPGRIPSDWKEIEYFDESWKERIHYMAQFITENASVMDIGCGKMWLKELLRANTYIPVDYVSRGDGTIVCDLNKKEFPSLQAQIMFVSGCLEYIRDHEWFAARAADACARCIVSYCTLDEYSNLQQRRNAAWVSDLKETEIVDLFTRNGFALVHRHVLKKNTIFVFDKKNA